MTAVHAIGVRSADMERVVHIYHREFRSAPIDRRLFEQLDPSDVGDLLVWWDERTELGGWETHPPAYLTGLPWALEYFGGGRETPRLDPQIVRPGQIWIEEVARLHPHFRSIRDEWGRNELAVENQFSAVHRGVYERLRPWPKKIDALLREFGVRWQSHEAKSVARFVRIERIDLERWTNRWRAFVLHYVGWWSVIPPNSHGDAAAISEHLKPAERHVGRVTKPSKGKFQIRHLFESGRFTRADDVWPEGDR